MAEAWRDMRGMAEGGRGSVAYCPPRSSAIDIANVFIPYETTRSPPSSPYVSPVSSSRSRPRDGPRLKVAPCRTPPEPADLAADLDLYFSGCSISSMSR